MMNVRLVKHLPKRLTDRENIDEQGAREGYFTHYLYHFFSNFDYPVIDILDFITVRHG